MVEIGRVVSANGSPQTDRQTDTQTDRHTDTQTRTVVIESPPPEEGATKNSLFINAVSSSKRDLKFCIVEQLTDIKKGLIKNSPYLISFRSTTFKKVFLL